MPGPRLGRTRTRRSPRRRWRWSCRASSTPAPGFPAARASSATTKLLFSATFFWKGYTGLAITAGAIATLFVIMQITGRLDWAAVLRRARPPAAPAGWPPAAAP